MLFEVATGTNDVKDIGDTGKHGKQGKQRNTGKYKHKKNASKQKGIQINRRYRN